MADGAVTTGDDAYELVCHSVSRRDFRCICDADSAACAGSHVEYTSTAFHALGYCLNNLCNLRNCLFNRIRDCVVLVVDTA